MPGSIAVFGASGNTGRSVVACALRKGVRVRALYRPGSEPNPVPPGLEVVTGQLTQRDDVGRVLAGTEAAVLVFGPRLGGLFSKPPVPPEAFCTPATANVVAEMQRLGVRRIVCQTGAMAGKGTANWSRGVGRFVQNYWRKFPEIAADRDRQERVVQESGLDWVVVRPFRISRARGVGKVHAAPAIHIGLFTSIRRDDLADFLVSEATAGRFHGQAVYAVKG